MALLQNRSQRASFLVKHIGATGTASEAGHLRSVLGVRNVSLLLMFTAEGFGKTSSCPVGYQPGNAIFPPMASGGMGVSIGYIGGSGGISNASLINALRLIIAALSGSGNITSADGRPALSATADLTGSGGVTDAALGLIVSAIASLAGSGSISSSLSGSLSALADLSGSGDVTDAAIGAIAGMLASLSGEGQVAAQPYARAIMAAAINVTGGSLTTANVASLVWDALAASFNDSGTLGAKLNSAAAGGIDYDALAAAVWAYATRELAGDQEVQIAELHKVHGLKVGAPLQVSSSARVAGDVSQNIVEAAGVVTVSRA